MTTRLTRHVVRKCTDTLRRCVGVMASLAVATGLAHAQAQAFPTKPLELRVPYVAGTAPDAVARTLAEVMGRDLGQPVLVVNQPGAGGAIGYKYVHSQKPDGYTMVLTSNSLSTAHHAGMLPFDYRGLDTVARVSVELPVLAVKADSPFANLKDVVAYAKANPGAFKVGNPGVGSHMHLMAVGFFMGQNVEVNQVPFATTGHIGTLLGGHIDAVVALPGTVSANVKSGGLRVLGVLAKSREPLFPDVPSATEQGLPFEGDLWRGIAVPKGTPPAVIARLEQAVRAAVQSPAFQQRGQLMGFVPSFATGPQLVQYMATEDALIAQLMDKTGLKAK